MYLFVLFLTDATRLGCADLGPFEVYFMHRLKKWQQEMTREYLRHKNKAF